MTTAQERLAQLQDERAKRMRLEEEATRALASYRENMGVLAVTGTATDKVVKQIATLRDAADVHASAVLVLDASIEASKLAIIEERRIELEALAETARAELETHEAKVGKALSVVYDLEETDKLRLEGTTGTLPKSARMRQKATHFQKQASRLGMGLPELPFDSMLY